MGNGPTPPPPPLGPSPSGPISPCVGICLMDPVRRLCRGCWRTIDEIAGWYSATATEKHAILARIGERRAEKSRE